LNRDLKQKKDSILKELIMEIGKLHVILVHFPIALALSAVLADVLWAATRKDFFRISGMYCLTLAAIAVIPTVYTGWELLEIEQRTMVTDYLTIAHIHRACAITSLVLIIAATIIRHVRKNRLQSGWLAVYAILMVLITGFISATGHFGGMLTHGTDYLSGIF
jgi:uncharacterized membrane protein